MNSIFLRLYGGLLLALCFIGAITYASVELVNHYRSDLYREAMARGTFYLMAEGYQRYESQERERWSQVLSKLFNAEITLKNAQELQLGYREDLHLSDGLVVMRLNDSEGYADILFQLPGEDAYITTRMTKVSEQQARATAVLILNHLSHFPEAEWQPALARLQQHFGYSLSLVSRDSVSLDDEQEQRLNRREVVIALDDSTRRDSSIRIFAPVAQTGMLLMLGPLSLFDQFPIELLLIAGALSLLAVAFATYLQVSPLQRRLKQLDRAVSQLGTGDLGAYANIEGNDAIGQVAATFNGMTAHIRRLIESQREMTRAVSHELRTPVARLRFGLEMLADIESADMRRERLNAMDHDIEQLDQLIDEILTYARLEQGTPNIEFKPVVVAELCEQLREELETIRGDTTITVECANPRLDVEAEERYLHRVLQNLVTNALRYAGSSIVMRVSESDGQVVIHVDDDGPGIPEHERERVFKPFARLDKSRHRASGGYGLGLSIVKRIVDWHGGVIRVEESPAGGARFTVELPRTQQEQHVLVRMG
ncbi:MAG: ATP-binding protein [Pseudomonadales bacterium]|uniref:ATP-binding protein n=1 Tax=Alcanivorax sp. MD8A TaxID=1177157 RepID=UPI000C9B77FC|nr:ATP-binding protein [Alcanivorax sp. MD8A]MCG8437280.1 ATP-binding protein [Pseudomonadales bacterium]MEE2870163.1 ATP-binding protein [Pseudomonadota bacterium]PNE04268.1 sensor histidine kinase rstB [Alcanivorax sp. MD8A]